jgi:hypothetical protein
MYAQDYDEQAPPWWNNVPKVGPVYWHYWLKPYVKNIQVFICPSATGCSANEGPPSLTAAEREKGVKACLGFDGHAKWTKEETLLQHPEWFIAGSPNIPAVELEKFGAVGR